jgi:hypothetical protein
MPVGTFRTARPHDQADGEAEHHAVQTDASERISNILEVQIDDLQEKAHCPDHEDG